MIHAYVAVCALLAAAAAPAFGAPSPDPQDPDPLPAVQGGDRPLPALPALAAPSLQLQVHEQDEEATAPRGGGRRVPEEPPSRLRGHALVQDQEAARGLAHRKLPEDCSPSGRFARKRWDTVLSVTLKLTDGDHEDMARCHSITNSNQSYLECIREFCDLADWVDHVGDLFDQQSAIADYHTPHRGYCEDSQGKMYGAVYTELRLGLGGMTLAEVRNHGHMVAEAIACGNWCTNFRSPGFVGFMVGGTGDTDWCACRYAGDDNVNEAYAMQPQNAPTSGAVYSQKNRGEGPVDPNNLSLNWANTACFPVRDYSG